jgi:nicotinamidase-related amidase
VAPAPGELVVYKRGVSVLEDCCASRVREVHRFSIDVILRSLCMVTTAERFIRALEGDQMGR